jgi:L-ascorbate metabolism protein UlaG (beta-lactamase superfamily)
MGARWSGCRASGNVNWKFPMADSLEARIKAFEVKPGSVACVWLGQAGYLFKTPAGVIVMIDPYLSDWAEDQWGMARVIPPAIDSAKLQPDLLLISHWHEDHLDAPLVKQWAGMNPGTFAGSVASAPRAQAWGWPADRCVSLDEGMTYEQQDVHVTAHFARHEVPTAPATDAISFLLTIDGVKIWAVCDTEYDARLRPMAHFEIDVALTPINGVGGNMTDKEAALLLSYVKPRLAIPNHYNMWMPETFGAGATLDPNVFVETYRLLGGGATQILDVGEIVTFLGA